MSAFEFGHGVRLLWTAYTPTLKAVTSDPTLGSGSSAAAAYAVLGDLIIVRFGFVFGSSGANAGSGSYYIAPPVGTIHADSQRFHGSCFLYDSSASLGLTGVCDLDVANERIYFWAHNVTGQVQHATPFAWTNNDQLHGGFEYRNG